LRDDTIIDIRQCGDLATDGSGVAKSNHACRNAPYYDGARIYEAASANSHIWQDGNISADLRRCPGFRAGHDFCRPFVCRSRCYSCSYNHVAGNRLGARTSYHERMRLEVGWHLQVPTAGVIRFPPHRNCRRNTAGSSQARRGARSTTSRRFLPRRGNGPDTPTDPGGCRSC
jgi:hypothetical protein